MSPPLWGTQVPGGRVAFLVGAGRSGTTLLHKLLCLHPGVAYITNYENRLPWVPDGWAARVAARWPQEKLRSWFADSGNAYYTDRSWLKKSFPTPHEGEAIYAACGVPLIPGKDSQPDTQMACALRRRFESIRRGARAEVFLSKRTANNRRIPLLRSIFPAARYVHLLRDGRDVAQSLSTVAWWNDHHVWWDGRTPVEMERAGELRLAVCARNWVRELEALQAGLAGVPSGRVLTLRFEDLLREPVHQVERILGFLELDCPATVRHAVASLGIRPGTGTPSRRWTVAQRDLVLREAQPLLRQLGYMR